MAVGWLVVVALAVLVVSLALAEVLEQVLVVWRIGFE